MTSMRGRSAVADIIRAALCMGVALVAGAHPVLARGLPPPPAVFVMGAAGPEVVGALTSDLAEVNLPRVGTHHVAANGFNNGGCTNNGACNNLQVDQARVAYWTRDNNHYFHGASTFSLLVPVNAPQDGSFYDFSDTLSNVTSDGDSLCLIKNHQASSSSASVPLSYWPTGHRSTGSSHSDTVGVGAGGASYSSTFTDSEGYLDGDIGRGQGGGPSFYGSWGYGDATEHQAAAVCDLRSAAIESAVAFRTPAAAGEPTLLFGARLWYQENA